MSGSRVDSSASSAGGREKRGGAPTRAADTERERGVGSEMSDEVTLVTAEEVSLLHPPVAAEKDSPDAALGPQDVRRSPEGGLLRPEREWFNMICYGLPNLVVTVVIGKKR